MNKQEKLLVDLIKEQINIILKEGEEPIAPEEEAPEEEAPEEEAPEEEEEGLPEDLADLTAEYIKKLKRSSSEIGEMGVAEMASMLIEAFGYGSSTKLSILQTIKQAIIK
tara:strand:- start:2683 stop:3012 length:330 start_codon:yes stop_codon:yes gene_type:complete